MDKLKQFTSDQLDIVNSSVETAEDLVSNFYKMSTSQWLRRRYDIKTLANLSSDEIVNGPFAQIIRYVGQHKNSSLGSSTYDFYKICLQDHSICETLSQSDGLELFPFTLYIITHELIHIVRFTKFLQSFDASPDEKMKEETRVHHHTHKILKPVNIAGLAKVFEFYSNWHTPLEGLRNT
ncbi:MAG: hypothetical protein SWH54_02760 [Thermodesulfobacteriota bacterium]|nr:hypothetical protein [Thermodesulfobacteriota bacterium]